MRTSVIFEGPEGVAVDTGAVRFIGTVRADVVDVARREREQGADRIELCGGLGPIPHAGVRRAVDAGVEVGAVMYGFESLESTTDFKQRFAAGHELRAAFLYLRPGADPVADRIDDRGISFVPIPDAAAARTVATALNAEGIELLELYVGLDPEAAAAALSGVEGKASVGLALYPGHV